MAVLFLLLVGLAGMKVGIWSGYCTVLYYALRCRYGNRN